jgi:predicted ATPase/ribosome-binding protein aMBF1 (putative translation factor)
VRPCGYFGAPAPGAEALLEQVCERERVRRREDGISSEAKTARTVKEREIQAVRSSDFGTLLRRHRLTAGLSQEALADLARMSTNGIGALERGDRRTPQRETLALLAKALGLDAEQRREFEAAGMRPGTLRPGDGRTSIAGARSTEDRGQQVRNNLPIALTSLIGRDVEIVEISALVREHRLVTLTGAGGVGKTRCALEIATRSLNDPDAGNGAWLIELAPLRDAALISATIARVLELQTAQNDQLLETLLSYLKQKMLLLILDNCEHLVEAVASVSNAILRGCPHVRILATSREPLRVAGEHIYRMPSLSVPSAQVANRLALSDAGRYGAVMLFAERARAADHQFILTDGNTQIVGEICRRLDGIPLAIELAAAYVATLPLKTISEKLDGRFAILTGGDRTTLPRQRTMRALIDWSYDLLSSQERLLLVRLAVFQGGFTADAVTAVCVDEYAPANVIELLSSLVGKSLVVAEITGDAVRYRLLESVRAYGLEKIDAMGALVRTAERHARWVAQFAETAAKQYWELSFEQWLVSVEPELDNVRAALDWIRRNESAAVMGAQIAGNLHGLWAWGTLIGEGGDYLENALDCVAEADHPRTVATIHYAIADINVGAKRVPAAERAYALFEQIDDRFQMANSLVVLCRGYRQMGRHEAAQLAATKALRAYQTLGRTTSWQYACALTASAAIEGNLGRYDRARNLAEEAMTLSQTLGDRLQLATCCIHLGELEFKAGEVTEAISHALEAADMFGSFRDSASAGWALHNAAAYLIASGDLERGRLCAIDALVASRDARSAVNITIAILQIATTMSLLGNARRAAVLCGYVDKWFRESGFEREFTEQQTYALLVAALCKELAEDELLQLTMAGTELSEAQAVIEALR